MKWMQCILLCLVVFRADAVDLNIGLLSNDPPFSIQVSSNNAFTGFDAQLISEVCKRLNAKCTYHAMPFNDFFPQLTSKKIDLAIGEITITADRAKYFLFSQPYMAINAQYITNSDSSIKSLVDLKGSSIGIYQNSIYKQYVMDQFNDQITINEFTTLADAFDSLVQKKSDALLFPIIAEKYWIANNYHNKQFKNIGSPLPPIGFGYGIMATLQSSALIDQVNQTLKDMEKDGTYQKIYNLYFADIAL